MDSGKVWFGKNNTWQASGNPSAGTNEAYSSLSGTFGPFAGKDAAGNQPTVVLNCGQRPFTYTPPSGFVALNTYNLPTPTILQGNKYMDATLYTGTNAILTVTNAGGFYPDFTWLRIRNQAYGYSLFDSVRGATKSLQSQSTNAETTQGAGTGINSFNSNGFTLGTDVATNGSTNYNTGTYVAWQWLANAGSTVSNTSGSITSTVSVNTTAGFSVVTYTGTGTAATVGHGLGVAPAMIIIKRRNGVTDWATYHASVGNTKALFLNRDIAADTGASYWNNTSPTSTVFTVGTGADVNPSSGTMVAYCWAEIAGFSKFGSYTGNGSADGPFVYTGFRPKYVLIKRTDGPNAWYVLDSTRNTYNVMNLYLELQDPAAEGTFTFWDFLSNGFKLRQTASGINGSGQTIIYMAFAENPFKNANAR